MGKVKTEALGCDEGTGSSTSETGGVRSIIAIDKDSIAAKSGFQVKDQVLALDGVPAPDRDTWTGRCDRCPLGSCE